jgi:hypothetical protein
MGRTGQFAITPMMPTDSNENSIMQHSSKTEPAAPREPLKKVAQVVSKKPYRKPVLKRLGVLKSVAGSGIVW